MDNSTLLELANLTTSVLSEPAKAATRAKPTDPQGSIFRHFGVQSPKQHKFKHTAQGFASIGLGR